MTKRQRPNGEIKIEEGVPMPVRRVRGAKYPFADMKVGDSFFSDDHRAGNAAYQYARGRQVLFSTRREAGGVRVWRIA